MDNPEPQQQADNKCGETDEQVSPGIAKLDVPVAPSDSGKRDDSKKHWIDYAKFGLEICGFVVLCVYAYFTIRIYCASKEAADAARSAAETAKQTLLVSQRPWVGMRGYFLPTKLLPNTQMSASYAQVNSGHGPALSVGNRVAFGILEQILSTETAEAILAKTPPPNRYPLFPGIEVPVGQASLTINDYWLGRVNSGKAWLYYFGDASYLDEFSSHHRTRFCSAYNPKAKQFQHCDIFNDAT
jgi:hypothetical protein